MKTRVIPVTEARKEFLVNMGLNPSDVNAWRIKWQRVRYHASRRGLQCLLTFEQYITLACDAELSSPDQVGTGIESYQLGRYGDIGDYSLDNCRFIPREQNILEWDLNGGKHKMVEMLRGRTKEDHAGIKSQSEKLSKSFQVVSPEGVIYNASNLTDFCKDHGLNRGNMSSVCRGSMKSYKGWTGKYI